MAPVKSKYDRIIETIFRKYFSVGIQEFEFDRNEVVEAADQLGIARPKNVGDILYTYRYRRNLPAAISATAPKGHQWIIRSIGIAKYRFVLTPEFVIAPAQNYATIKIYGWPHCQDQKVTKIR